MTEKTDLNVSPYYDDFSEDKNFHKVLYRSGRPLQSRELIQSQSILQNQIERFGDHMFKEGSIVQGCQSGLDLELYYVKVKSANPNSAGDANAETYRTASVGKYYQGKTSGVVAQVITTSAETSDDALTLFVKYVRQGTDSGNSFTFTPVEEIQEVTLGATGTPNVVTANKNEFEVKAKTDADNPNGLGSVANIKEGIIFIRGFFIKVPAQELILEKYSGAPSYRIGLTIKESLISEVTDTSLLDNSQGTSNENSSGADRLKIELTLSKYSLTTTDDTDFVELIRVNKGIIEIAINKPIYGAIENTMARRTFDASGDFVTQQFTHSLREHLDDTTNRGFYTKVNGGTEDKFVMQVSPGKAYVKGYEIDKVGTSTVAFKKARDATSLDNANTPVRIGNYIKIKNAHSLPEFGNEGGEDSTEPFKPIEIWDSTIPVTSPVGGTKPTSGQIGLARVRNIDLDTGTASSGIYTDASRHQLYLFDIKMFTKITGTTATAAFAVGDKVVGSVSGATGIVAVAASTGAASILVHDVVGTFTDADAISAVGKNDTAVIANVTAVRTYNIDRARSVTQTPLNGSREIFTADIYADQDNTLTGSCTITGNTALTGFGTKFTTQLKEGDIIMDGAVPPVERVVASITSDIAATISGTGNNLTNANCTRRRVRVFNQDQTAAIASWPRDWVKTHTGESIQIRKQTTVEIGTGAFSISITNGTFAALNTDNFTIAVAEEKAGGSFSKGDLLNIEDMTTNVSGSGGGSGQTLAVSNINVNNNDAILKVTYTANVVDPVSRSKNLRSARCLAVESNRVANGFYGTAYDDEEISLGVADVHKIRGIYEATGGATTPLPPSATFTVSSGTFVNYETVIGQTSNAHAVIISTGGTTYFYYISGTLVNTENVVGQTSGAVATLSNVTAGGQNIISRYFFDNGQRDGYYDIGKLTLKTGAPKPNNKILIVFDYFTPSGAGDYFDVSSYSAIEYKDIPVYSPSRVDLGGLEPDGTFELSDCVDFRPVVGQIIGTTTFGSNNAQDVTNPVDLSDSTNGAVYSPFGYTTGRSFLGARTGITATGTNTNDTPVSGSSVVGDISFYVGRYDKVFLHKSGKFQISEGTPALSPTKPKSVDDSIEMFDLYIPPFTKNLKNIRIRSKDHRRFTMSDIGRINNRVTNLERVTSLSLLERDTQTKQILDGDGFDRFKSGFLVDNFRGHRVGDVTHPDYECAIDVKAGAMRPQSYQSFFDIELNTSSSTSYQKTGDLITLPYTESTFVHADKASRISNVNPYSVFSFMGSLKLSPATDIWHDTTQLPEVRINREGNFDAIKSTVENSLGTVWNAWQTTWVGEPTVVSTEVQSTSNGSWSGDPTQGGEWQAGEEVTREITETVETQTRTGVTTSVVEDFVETRGDRIVSVTLIPFCRARTITLDGENLKPNTNHYFFFDSIDVNAYVRPFSTTYSQDSGTSVGSHCKTDGAGRIRAYFELPNNPTQSFATGMREMRVTSSFYNLPNPASACSEVYQAQGLLQASQTEITSTRNGRVVYEQMNEQRDIISRGESTNINPVDTEAPPIPEDTTPPVPDPVTNEPPVAPPSAPIRALDEMDLWEPDRWMDFREMRGWRDPLAQSFLIDSTGGMFMSSVDLYFQTKDDTLPVSVEIRTMHNGYPANVVVPFSTVNKNPADVNTSTDGSTATTFTFESPVYLDDGVEYCFVVYTNSDSYNCFVSRMGEKDIATGQTIAEQPYAGSLFKSQNNSTWTAEQTDDLKFHLKRCVFDTTKIPYVSFDNAAIPTQIIQDNPIQTFSGQDYVKVYAYSHGMYHTSSSTTIANVKGDTTGSVLTITATNSGGTPADGTYNVAVTGGSGSGMTVEIVVSSSGSSIVTKITNPGSGYKTSDTNAVCTNYNGACDLAVAINSIGDTLGGMPVDAINASFTALKNIGIDTFCVTPSLSAYNFKTGYTATASTVGGGEREWAKDDDVSSATYNQQIVVGGVTATRDYYFDTLHTMIPNISAQGTKISATVKTTPMYSPEGSISGTVYTKGTTSKPITLNDNSWFSHPSVIASPINETNNMSGVKSFEVGLQLYSNNPNISPVIDVATIGGLGIMNRINNIDSSSDVPTGTTYIDSTQPDGDSNVMTYITRKVSLKTPAQGLRVTADFFRPPTTELKVLYKVLNNDDETPFDDLGWKYFNTTGASDTTTEADARNFKEYEFTADDLNEFSAFSIKIVGQGTNTSVVPMVSALRCIAIA